MIIVHERALDAEKRANLVPVRAPPRRAAVGEHARRWAVHRARAAGDSLECMAKILLVAPGVNRDDVGEAWVGYQWASRLCRHHDVTLLTYRKRGRESVRDQLPEVEVVEWREPRLLGRAERFNSLFKPWYFFFYRSCRKWIKDAAKAGRRFDVAHQPTPVAMRYPSPLAGSGIPYIVGPVGGSLNSPPGFADEDTAPWYVKFRKIDALRLRHDPLLRSTYTGASVVLGIAPYVLDLLAALPIRRFEALSETGVGSLPDPVERSHLGSPVKLLFVGRVVRTKGVRDIVQALDQLRDLDVVLEVVGDGFDRPACVALTRELGLQDRVNFRGSMPRAQVDAFYQDADVFVFPSYREPGGNAPFEAMGYGLPLIVADRGGPGHVVNGDCGILVHPVDPAQYATEIAHAIRKLVESPLLRATMGQAARAYVSHYGTWDHRVAEMNRLYQEIQGDHQAPRD